jgi:secondary thiamine-phosphate synthase enzyme
VDLAIKTRARRQVIDITSQIDSLLPAGAHGAAVITVLHTTAAVTTADLDPGTDLDLLDALEALITPRPWRHPHDPAHAPDHLLASIVGPSVTVPVHAGKLVLGTWQRLILIEFSGPRQRRLLLTLLG